MRSKPGPDTNITNETVIYCRGSANQSIRVYGGVQDLSQNIVRVLIAVEVVVQSQLKISISL